MKMLFRAIPNDPFSVEQQMDDWSSFAFEYRCPDPNLANKKYSKNIGKKN